MSNSSITIPTLREFRVLLRARYHLTNLTGREGRKACGLGQTGCSDCLDQLCQELRTVFVARRGGLRRYLFDMLGKEGHRDAVDCRLIDHDGGAPAPADLTRGGTIVEFLTSNFTTETLPWGVFIPNGQGKPKLHVF